MLENIYYILLNALMITGFVFVMMLVIEYINVQSHGLWQKSLTGSKWKQYIMAGLLGAIPGCLGAFTVVALFSHRLVSFGAVVAAMIATSGDEAFIMFAMVPQKAILITVIILIIGIVAGFFSDKIFAQNKILDKLSERNFPLHTEDQCHCFQKDKLLHYILHPSIQRVVLVFLLLLLMAGVLMGVLAGEEELWLKITILLTVSFSLFVVVSVPEHFLKKHLWEHIVKVHVPRIFLWTFGTLLAIHFLMDFVDVQSWISDNMLTVLIIAVLVGIIPESGPHLIFLTLFVQGTIPFSVLLASSIAQDGHGMLPLLAESKRGFLAVKAVNIIVALIVGFMGYLTGF
ncbi:MAG: putative manganese transporter [Bacteroidales bacterium]|nr:putative manganese transporter [Bacteroidales bacterium]